MGEILPRHYLFGILIFTFFIVGGVSLFGIMKDSNADFGGDKLDEFNNTFNKLDDVSGVVNSLDNSTKNAKPDQGVFGVLNSLISSSWNTLKLLTNSLSFFTLAIGDVSSFFGIPSWATSIVIAMITIIIVFSIFSAIFQRDI